MKYIFVNLVENRFRAGWRILFQSVIAIVLIIVFSAIPSSFVSGTILGAVAILISIAVAAWLLDKRDIQSYGLSFNKVWFLECFKGILAGFIAISSIFVILFIFGSIEFAGFGWDRTLPDGFISPFLGYLGLMMVVGFYEEIWMRGYLLFNIRDGLTFQNFDERKAMMVAIAITSIIFGLLHAGNPNASFISTFNIVLAGVMLALPVYFTGSLAIPIGLHASWNFFMGGFYGMPVSGTEFRESLIQSEIIGESMWTGGEFGPEAGVVGLLAMAGLSAWMVLTLKDQKSGI